jgi:flagellin FlaB
MLLVAAVAAGVLIQTASSLQQRALATGSQARGEISTNARVIEVSGGDGTTGEVQNFTMQMKLSPGSDPIKLDEVTLTLNTDDSTVTLIYLEDNDFSDSNDYCGAGTLPSNCSLTAGEVGNFTVEYLINGSNHIPGNLQRGDVIRVYFQSDTPIGEDARIRINFIPKIGTATLVEFNTPDVISTQQVYMYP